MKIIKHEEKSKEKKPSKAEVIKKGVGAAIEIYGKHQEKKAETKAGREKFVKDKPATKKQPLPEFKSSMKETAQAKSGSLPNFSTSKKSIR